MLRTLPEQLNCEFILNYNGKEVSGLYITQEKYVDNNKKYIGQFTSDRGGIYKVFQVQDEFYAVSNSDGGIPR